MDMKKFDSLLKDAVYREVGCSQEHHLIDCAHFGKSGGYLSPHDKTCPCFKSNKARCNCNPKARLRIQSK